MLRVGYKGMVAFSLKLQNIPQLETDFTQINCIIDFIFDYYNYYHLFVLYFYSLLWKLP